MGSCNDNMKTSGASGDKPKDKGVFGILPSRKKVADKGDSAELYGDYVSKADQKLQSLVAIKSKDLTSEKGCELVNSLKLGNLKNQQMHIDAIIDLMHEYQDIK